MNSAHKLTEGALEIIMNGGNVTDPVLQVLGSKKIVSNNSIIPRYRLLLSDGKYTISVAMMTTQLNDKIGGAATQDYTIIKLTRYITNLITSVGKADTRILVILDIELVASGTEIEEKIGTPTPLTTYCTPTSTSQFFNNSDDVANVPSTSSTITYQTIRKHNQITTQINNNLNTDVISPIATLSPFHNNWVIRARVTFKSNVRTWTNAQGEGKLFSIDLMDESGEIRCTAFRELVDKFYDSFEVDKVYYLSKCKLKLANKQFCPLNCHYEMTLVEQSHVEECHDDGLPKIKYNFVSIDKISEIDPGSLIDVIGVCKGVSELQNFTSKISNRELQKREVVLIDQSKKTISLALWGQEAETFDGSNEPVILLKNAKIGEFGGCKNLTVTMRSQLKINPEIPEYFRLKSWYDAEGRHIQINLNEIIGLSGLQAPWMTFKEVQEKELGRSEKGDYYQVVATILTTRLDKMVYKACPSTDCNKKVIDMENGMYRCEKCNREYRNFEYRLLFSMNLADATSNQWVTVFASEAEKILGKTSEEVGLAIENDPQTAEKIFEDVAFKQFLFKCRVKAEIYNDEERLKTVVVRVDPINYEAYNSYLVGNIEKLLKF